MNNHVREYKLPKNLIQGRNRTLVYEGLTPDKPTKQYYFLTSDKKFKSLFMFPIL